MKMVKLHCLHHDSWLSFWTTETFCRRWCFSKNQKLCTLSRKLTKTITSCLWPLGLTLYSFTAEVSELLSLTQGKYFQGQLVQFVRVHGPLMHISSIQDFRTQAISFHSCKDGGLVQDAGRRRCSWIVSCFKTRIDPWDADSIGMSSVQR